jgi:hypothetical protein
MTSGTRVRGDHCCRFHRFILRHPLQLSTANFSSSKEPMEMTPYNDCRAKSHGCAFPLPIRNRGTS